MNGSCCYAPIELARVQGNCGSSPSEMIASFGLEIGRCPSTEVGGTAPLSSLSLAAGTPPSSFSAGTGHALMRSISTEDTPTEYRLWSAILDASYCTSGQQGEWIELRAEPAGVCSRKQRPCAGRAVE